LKPEFVTYQKQILANAQALAQSLTKNGLRLVSGGTDNHLMLVDLTSTERTGKDMETWLDKANITVNKNTIPNEKLSPSVTSGIRVGTPAITSRGFVESDMQIIGELIAEIAKYGENAIKPVKQVVSHLTSAHPLYE
jgi:glycine hydroxymethyltransferase